MRYPKIKKMPSGKYHAQVMIGSRRVSVTANSESAVKEKIKTMRMRHELLEEEPLRNDTWATAIDRYIASQNAVLSPSTIRTYKSIREHRFEAVMGKKLSAPLNWQRVINEEAGLISPKTLKNSWGLITAVMRSNDMKIPKVNLPQIVKSEKEFLDYEQIQELLDIIYDTDIEKAVLLALHGLRRSEIYACSVNAQKRLIIVSGAYVRGENGFVLKETNKNVTSNRSVPVFIPRLLEVADRDLCYAPESLARAINLICLRNDLPEVGVHGLRHSFASLCYSAGISEEQCMSWGGWSDPGTMRKIYTHLSEKDRNMAAEKLQNLFQ